MATVPEKDAPEPTRVERARKAVSEPAFRLPVALVVAAAAASLAPVPASTLAVAAIVWVAAEKRR